MKHGQETKPWTLSYRAGNGDQWLPEHHLRSFCTFGLLFKKWGHFLIKSSGHSAWLTKDAIIFEEPQVFSTKMVSPPLSLFFPQASFFCCWHWGRVMMVLGRNESWARWRFKTSCRLCRRRRCWFWYRCHHHCRRRCHHHCRRRCHSCWRRRRCRCCCCNHCCCRRCRCCCVVVVVVVHNCSHCCHSCCSCTDCLCCLWHCCNFLLPWLSVKPGISWL